MHARTLLFAAVSLPCTLAVSCSSIYGAERGESRARAAERLEAEAAFDDDAFSLPFDHAPGLPAAGVAQTLPTPPDMPEVPHADPARVQLDLRDAVQADERLRDAVHDLEVDWRDGVLVLDGTVLSQRAFDRVESLAQEAAPGTPIRNSLVIRVQ